MGSLPKVATVTLTGPPPPLDMEFKANSLTSEFFREGLNLGRCFGSKSAYRLLHPRNIFIPNANIFSRNQGKIWWGDLDLEKDKAALENIAQRLRRRLYVMDELDGRWQRAPLPFDEVLCCAQWHTGGATRVWYVPHFLKRSGLTLSQLAAVIKVSSTRLCRKQQPEIGLEVYRRMAVCDHAFGAITAELGFAHWGDWWTSPNEKLGGNRPLEVFAAGGTLDIGDLFGPAAVFHCLRLPSMLAKRL
jgi:hypothetical protein